VENRIFPGDCLTVLRGLPDQSVDCCVTSPPYWGLRDYGVQGQIGLEQSPSAYVSKLLQVFLEVRRVLRDSGTLWLNIGDTYIGYHGNRNSGDEPAPSDKPGYRENMRGTTVGADTLKNKDLAGIPWRTAFSLQDSGWYLRCDCIWSKPNPMPESVKDRPTRSHEYVFLFSKKEKYYFDSRAIREPSAEARGGRPQSKQALSFARTVNEPLRPDLFSSKPRQHRKDRKPVCCDKMSRNRRSVWEVPVRPFREAHFATFPPDLIRPCILAGCPRGGTVLDPFFGAGTTGVVCLQEGRKFVGIELNPSYVSLARQRLHKNNIQHKFPGI